MKAIALAGMLALLVGLIEIGLGLGKLGFVADLLSSEVQVGYMNGLAITIIVGQLPKLFGFSTDADGFFDEVRRVLQQPRRDGRARARGRRRCARRAARAAADHAARARGARRGRRRDRRLGGARPRVERRRDRRLACRRAFPTPTFPWTTVDDVGPLLIAAVGITLVSLTDTIATVVELRGPARRRGRARTRR